MGKLDLKAQRVAQKFNVAGLVIVMVPTASWHHDAMQATPHEAIRLPGLFMGGQTNGHRPIL